MRSLLTTLPLNARSVWQWALLFGILSTIITPEFSLKVTAQPISIRPAGGVESGALLSIRREPGVINHTDIDGLGYSLDNSFWLGVEVESPRFGDGLWSGIGRLGIGAANGSFRSNPYEAYGAADPISLKPVKSLLQFEVASTKTVLTCDLLAALHPFYRSMLVMGPWAKVRVSSATVEVERVANSEQLIFPETNTSERTIGAGKGIESFPINGGILTGIGYDIALSDALSIRPIVATRCDMGALISGLGRRSFAWEASLSCAFDFTAKENQQPIVTAPVVDTTAILAAASNIDIAVDLFNLDTAAGSHKVAIVKAQRTIHRQYIPLPPIVYFDLGADTISSYYTLERSEQEAIANSTKTRIEPLDIYSNLLNILGKRLRENEGATIVLQGSTVGSEPGELGRKRAERIRDYLQRIWGIPEARIRIENKSARNDAGKFPTVIISSSEPVLLAPTLSQWVVDDHILPHVGLSKRINSRLGVREWKLTISQHDHQIAQLTQQDISGEINAVLPLSTLSVDSIPAPLIAELSVTDYNGVSKSTQSELEIRIEPGNTAPSREVRVFYFFEPRAEFPSYSIANKALVEKIATTTRTGARILVAQGSAVSRSDGAWSGAVIAHELLSVLNARAIIPAELHLQGTTVAEATTGEAPGNEIFAQGVRVTVDQPITAGGTR